MPRFCVVVILLLLAMTAAATAADLKAGATRVDITPPVGMPLEGFDERKDPATGVLDPLMARVLVLENQQTRLALVTVDLCMMFSPRWLDDLRRRVKASSGISHLVVTASHTHSGPPLKKDYDGTPGWEHDTLFKIAGAIDEAHRRAVQARLGTGYGKGDVGYNRRRVNGFGKVEMVWENPSHTPMGPVDPTVSVLRIDALDGNPLAIVVNHALHPVVFGMAQRRYSADFIAPLVRTVESSINGSAVCLFLQGACGDINPYDADVPADQDPEAKCNAIGTAVGEEAARVARTIQTRAVNSLQIREDVLPLSARWKGDAQKSYSAPVSVILIDRRIALMTMPGEPFVAFQRGWKERCPVPDAFFVGYANGYLAYLPTIQAAAEGGYGAADDRTVVEPGAGERMLDHALVRTLEMLGHLRQAPRPWNAINAPE